jgi:hypothetical protein
MNRISHRRLRTPVFALVFGSVISTAIGIGQSWIGAAITYAVTAVVAGIFYVVGWSESESDASAVIGGRADERQKLVRLRAAQAGLVTAVVAAGIACLISAIVKAAFWPYEVIVDVVVVAYLIGLRAYGVSFPAEESEESPDEQSP